LKRLVLLAIVLGLATGIYQLQDLAANNHRMNLELVQATNFYKGEAGNLWQYRVLQWWIARGLMVFPFPKSGGGLFENGMKCVWELNSAFLQRMITNVLLFLSFLWFLATLQIKGRKIPLGMVLLTPLLCLAEIKSGLMANSYWEIVFILVGAVFILKGWLWTLPMLMIPATLNRETALVIPVMALVIPGGWKKAWPYISIAVFVVVEVILRHSFTPQSPQLTMYWGRNMTPGLPCLISNLTWPEAWMPTSS
jgi:hypothetical protein